MSMVKDLLQGKEISRCGVMLKWYCGDHTSASNDTNEKLHDDIDLTTYITVRSEGDKIYTRKIFQCHSPP
jgi:hypothetical protein